MIDSYHLENKLGLIAMKFRGNLKPGDREEAILEYAQVVSELVKSGVWERMPTPKEMLPDEYMPKAFFTHFGFRKLKITGFKFKI